VRTAPAFSREDGYLTTRKPVNPDLARLDRVVADARRAREERERGYRARALKLFPWICGRCAREFDQGNVHELTVHHKDHDHDNNPPDGSNWELLCLYCHDNEHSRYSVAEWYDEAAPEGMQKTVSTFKPFAGLESILKEKK
jgi:HNH endonuclease